MIKPNIESKYTKMMPFSIKRLEITLDYITLFVKITINIQS
jgi:hypothetical protein